MKLKLGQTLASPVDSTTIIVVRAPSTGVDLTCAGVPMWDPRSGGEPPPATSDPAQLGGSELGKRYADPDLGLELLCTRAGRGSLAVNGVRLAVAAPRALPASD
jgi:hypothetical protein